MRSPKQTCGGSLVGRISSRNFPLLFNCLNLLFFFFLVSLANNRMRFVGMGSLGGGRRRWTQKIFFYNRSFVRTQQKLLLGRHMLSVVYVVNLDCHFPRKSKSNKSQRRWEEIFLKYTQKIKQVRNKCRGDGSKAYVLDCFRSQHSSSNHY